MLLYRAQPSLGFGGFDGLGDWLVQSFTLLGVTFQNWMPIALALVLFAALIAWLRER